MPSNSYCASAFWVVVMYTSPFRLLHGSLAPASSICGNILAECKLLGSDIDLFRDVSKGGFPEATIELEEGFVFGGSDPSNWFGELVIPIFEGFDEVVFVL